MATGPREGSGYRESLLPSLGVSPSPVEGREDRLGNTGMLACPIMGSAILQALRPYPDIREVSPVDDHGAHIVRSHMRVQVQG